MKNILSLFVLAVLVSSCAPLPKVQVNGPYLQMYVNELPVVQVTYSSSDKCEQMANAEMQTMDVNSRRMVAQGQMQITCSGISQSDQLLHKASVTEILTNVKSEARFQSVDACQLIAPTLNKSYKMTC